MTRVQEMQKFIDEILDKANKEITMSVSKNRTYSYPRTVTVRDVYEASAFWPDGDVHIPEGYEYVDFRPPKNGEMMVGSCSGKATTALDDFDVKSPRIIIRKKPEPPPKQYLLVEVEPTSQLVTFDLGANGVCIKGGTPVRAVKARKVNGQTFSDYWTEDK